MKDNLKNILGVFVLILVVLFTPRNVFAEEMSDDFKRILNDGKIVINSTSFSLDGLIFQYLDSKKTDVLSYYYSNCNEDKTKCTITMQSTNSSISEIHDIEIEYKEVFSSEFNSLLTNGVFKFKTLKPTNMMEDNYFLYNYANSLSTKNYTVESYGCNEDYTMCEIVIFNDDKRENHVVKVVFEDEIKVAKTKLYSYIKTLDDLKTDDGTGWMSYRFDLVDLEMINYYATTKSKEFSFEKLDEMFPYSQTIKNIFKGSNYKYDYEVGMGSDQPFYSYGEGGLSILYEGVYYGVVENIGTSVKNILYIPSDTEKTPEAFIKAAEAKIKDYMPNLNVEISKGLSFVDYVYDDGHMKIQDVTDAVKDLVDINKTVNYVFVIDFGDFKVDFLIVADSTKVVKPEFLTYDLETNVYVSSKSSSIPLDTLLEVEKLESGTEYEKIIKALDVEENEMYDIRLYSNAKNKYITKLDSGKFEVRIPVPEKFEGKTLIVYYVDENNKIIEHEVTIKENEGYATFETNHFSIYTLTYKDNVSSKVKVTFDANGGKFDKDTTYVIDDWIADMYDSLKIPTRDGYKFKGYYTEKNGGTKFEMILNEAGIDNNSTFYAQWEENPSIPQVPQTFDGVSKYVMISLVSLVSLFTIIVYLKKESK